MIRFFHMSLLLLTTTWCVGCEELSAPSDVAPTAEQPAGVEAAAENAAAPEAPPQPQGFSQLEWKLVDKQKALEENPKLVETENKNNASDPFSAAAQSYFTIGSKAHVLALQRNIDIHKAQYDRNPTFDEFNTMIKQAHVDLKGLYPWQVYAYDSKTGQISILEDREEKARLHKEAGLPVSE